MSAPRRHETSADRALWNVLRPTGEPLDCSVTVRPSSVDIEADDGAASVSVYVQQDGVDVRVEDVQLMVKGKHLTLVQQHPPYPIERWSILWEGDLA